MRTTTKNFESKNEAKPTKKKKKSLPKNLNLNNGTFLNFNGQNLINASITTNGPLLKIKTRGITSKEFDDESDQGIELNSADTSRLTVTNSGVNFIARNSLSANVSLRKE